MWLAYLFFASTDASQYPNKSRRDDRFGQVTDL